MDLYYGDFHAIKDASLEILPNKITAFIGPSGCGKSTVLKSLNRMNDLVDGCRGIAAQRGIVRPHQDQFIVAAGGDTNM